MKYSVDKQERYCVMTLQDKNVNSVVAPELKSEFVVLANEGVRSLILDLSEVDYVDSSGLSAILTANRLWKGSDGSFVLTGASAPNVKKLIEISRLDTVLSIVPTVEESIEYVYMEDVERELGKEPADAPGASDAAPAAGSDN